MFFKNEENNSSGKEKIVENDHDKIYHHKIRSFIKGLFFTVLFAIFIKTFFIEAFRIPSGSMEKTLLVGDFILVNKFIYGSTTPRYLPFTNISLPFITLPSLRDPENGDIIVFEYPGDRDQIFPKERNNFL